MDKKAQAWGIDLFIGTVIFIIGITIFYLFLINNTDESNEIIEKMNYDGKVISNTLLSEGFPKDWNKDNVMNIGLLTGKKINHTKFDIFCNDLIAGSSANYNRTRAMFSTNFDYYVFAENTPYDIDNGCGKPGFDPDNLLNIDNLIKISRISIYEDKSINFVVYIFKE